MDKDLRRLERRLAQGDITAAQPLERARRMLSGPRKVIRHFDSYQHIIEERRIEGELEITPLSDDEIAISCWKVKTNSGWHPVALHVNDIPYNIRYTMHRFEEYGWIHTSTNNLAISQREREEAGRNWDLSSYLAGIYNTEPNEIVRRVDRPVQNSTPTQRGLETIRDLVHRVAETWALEHPTEMRKAQKIHLNNEIITLNEQVDALSNQLHNLSTRLTHAIFEEMD